MRVLVGRLNDEGELSHADTDDPQAGHSDAGDRSYLVHDGEVEFVVDPHHDVDRVVDLAGRERIRVTHVFETHIHNDYVTGGLALAELTGAAYF